MARTGALGQQILDRTIKSEDLTSLPGTLSASFSEDYSSITYSWTNINNLSDNVVPGGLSLTPDFIISYGDSAKDLSSVYIQIGFDATDSGVTLRTGSNTDGLSQLLENGIQPLISPPYLDSSRAIPVSEYSGTYDWDGGSATNSGPRFRLPLEDLSTDSNVNSYARNFIGIAARGGGNGIGASAVTYSITSAPISAFSQIIAGNKYRISENLDGTDFTTVGAPDSNVGTDFVASDDGDPALSGSSAKVRKIIETYCIDHDYDDINQLGNANHYLRKEILKLSYKSDSDWIADEAGATRASATLGAHAKVAAEIVAGFNTLNLGWYRDQDITTSANWTPLTDSEVTFYIVDNRPSSITASCLPLY